MWLHLDEVKAFLSITESIDDALLVRLMASAEDYVSQYLGRPVPWTEDDSESSSEPAEVPIPESVRQAAMMIVADLYRNREAHGATVQPHPSVHSMLSLYRVGLGV